MSVFSVRGRDEKRQHGKPSRRCSDNLNTYCGQVSLRLQVNGNFPVRDDAQ